MLTFLYCSKNGETILPSFSGIVILWNSEVEYYAEILRCHLWQRINLLSSATANSVFGGFFQVNGGYLDHPSFFPPVVTEENLWWYVAHFFLQAICSRHPANTAVRKFKITNPVQWPDLILSCHTTELLREVCCCLCACSSVSHLPQWVKAMENVWGVIFLIIVIVTL